MKLLYSQAEVGGCEASSFLLFLYLLLMFFFVFFFFFFYFFSKLRSLARTLRCWCLLLPAWLLWQELQVMTWLTASSPFFRMTNKIIVRYLFMIAKYFFIEKILPSWRKSLQARANSTWYTNYMWELRLMIFHLFQLNVGHTSATFLPLLSFTHLCWAERICSRFFLHLFTNVCSFATLLSACTMKLAGALAVLQNAGRKHFLLWICDDVNLIRTFHGTFSDPRNLPNLSESLSEPKRRET